MGLALPLIFLLRNFNITLVSFPIPLVILLILMCHAVTVTSEDGFSIPAGQELPTELVSKSHLNNDRVLFSLGGVTGSRYFSELCFTAASRAKFIDQIISFTSLWNFDGIDMGTHSFVVSVNRARLIR